MDALSHTIHEKASDALTSSGPTSMGPTNVSPMYIYLFGALATYQTHVREMGTSEERAPVPRARWPCFAYIKVQNSIIFI